MSYVRDPDAAATRPDYTDLAEDAGWFRPANPGEGEAATPITPDSLNRLMARIWELEQALGIEHDPNVDTQLATAMLGRIGAILGGASPIGTGTVSTDMACALVAAVNSRAATGPAAVMASSNSGATNSNSVVIASDEGRATGAQTAALAGQKYEVNEAETAALGHGTGAFAAANENQNLTIALRANGGHAAFKGKVRIGGDPNDPDDTTHKAEIDGADGSARFDGAVQAARLVMPAGSAGDRHGTASFTGLSVAPGALSDVLTIPVSGMDLTSKAQVTVAYRVGGAPVTVATVSGVDGFNWQFENVGGTECTRVDINWLITDAPE